MQLTDLPFKTKPNRYNPRGPPAHIYKAEDLRRVAYEKWAGAAGFEAEAAKRLERRKNRKPSATTAAPTGNKDTTAIPDIDRAEDAISVGAAVLRPLLAERVRVLDRVGTAPAEPPGQHHRSVLYWMNTAQRSHENPALEVAALEARERGVPLRVVSVLLEKHRFMNARRMAFALEGLRDVQKELGKLSVQHEVRSHDMQYPH